MILLDVMMPGMDGLEVFTELKSNPETSEIPVIFVTGADDIDEVEHYVSLGAIGVISKPFTPAQLPTQLADFWNAYAC